MPRETLWNREGTSEALDIGKNAYVYHMVCLPPSMPTDPKLPDRKMSMSWPRGLGPKRKNPSASMIYTVSQDTLSWPRFHVERLETPRQRS